MSTCFIVDLKINETLQTGAVSNRTYPDNKFIPIYRDARRVGIYPEHRGFIGGIETEGRKCLFIFRSHHNYVITNVISGQEKITVAMGSFNSLVTGSPGRGCGGAKCPAYEFGLFRKA